jgi:hypothetical protein
VLGFNRGTGRYFQSVTIVNNGTALAASAFVLDSLAAGYTVYQLNGTPVTTLAAPLGSPYLEVGPIAAGASVTFTVEFTRVGTPALVYTPRVLAAGIR